MAKLSFRGGWASYSVMSGRYFDFASSNVLSYTASLVASGKLAPYADFTIHGAIAEVALFVINQRRALGAAEFGSLHNAASALPDAFATLHGATTEVGPHRNNAMNWAIDPLARALLEKRGAAGAAVLGVHGDVANAILSAETACRAALGPLTPIRHFAVCWANMAVALLCLGLLCRACCTTTSCFGHDDEVARALTTTTLFSAVGPLTIFKLAVDGHQCGLGGWLNRGLRRWVGSGCSSWGTGPAVWCTAWL
jgi:hypothetical protein